MTVKKNIFVLIAIFMLPVWAGAAPVLTEYQPDPTDDLTPTLEWQAVSGATNYKVQIDDQSSFPSPSENETSNTSYTPSSDLPEGDVYWKVSSDLDDVFSEYDHFVISVGDTAILSVTPSEPQNIPATSGTKTFTVEKTGSGTMNWTASVTSEDSWLSITSENSGTDSGIITVSYEANPDDQERPGSVTVTASGATGSPKSVDLIQAAGGSDAPVLSVSPTSRIVSGLSSTTTFTVSNTGTGTMNWTASANDSWLSIASGASGTDTGTITVSYEENSGDAERTGTLTVSASGATPTFKIISVKQSVVSDNEPVLSVTPASQDVFKAGGTTTFTVSNDGTGTMNWTALATDSWLTIASGASGTDTGTITVSYEENPGDAERTGTLTVSAPGATPSFKIVSVKQSAVSGGEPVLSVTPPSLSALETSGTKTFTVENTGTGTMEWTASATEDWLTIDSGDESGTLESGESGTITVNYKANSGIARTGSFSVSAPGATPGFQIIAVSQAAGTGGPVLSVEPPSQDASESVGTVSFTVKNEGSDTMIWAASKDKPWLTIDSGETGTLESGESGTITVSYEANSGEERTCGITVIAEGAGNSPAIVTVIQAGPVGNPILLVTPTLQDASKDAGTTTFAVKNDGTGVLNWTAEPSDAPWLTILSGDSGTVESGDSGTIIASYDANPGSERVGTVKVTDSGDAENPQYVAVKQAAADMPSLSVTPDSQDVSKESGTTTFIIEIPGYVSWNASTSYDWLTILSGTSGSGSDTILVSYGINPGNEERTGKITVTASGVTGSPKEVQIKQSGLASGTLILSVTPDSRDVLKESGSTTFSVEKTGTGTMSWNASTTDSWLTITSGAGTNSGTITVSYNANSGIGRDGTITVTSAEASNSPQTGRVIQESGIVNHDPTDITLSSTDVAENQPADIKVGSFSTTDADSGDTHTYSLVSGAGASDNASFRISGTDLRTEERFVYSVKSSYSIRVETYDGNGGTYQKAFTISVTDGNDDPTDITLSADSVAENESVGTEVGTFTTTDPDVGDTHTYTLLTSDNGAFSVVGGVLRTQRIFDYETKSDYTIRVKTDDGSGGVYEKDFFISVSNINDNPTDITLDHSIVSEGLPFGTVVGAFTTTDQDIGDIHTYDLAAGAGGDDNNSFFIEYSTLKTNEEFSYEEKHSYTIRVRTTDSESEFYDKQFTITVTAAPTASFIPKDGAKNVGINENISITFSKPVRLTDDSAITSANADGLIIFRKDDANGDNVPFDATINGGKTAITIYPDFDFESNQTYYVAIGATVEDDQNNAISPTSVTFTSEDTEPPTVTFSPSDGAEDVAAGAYVKVIFSEPVRLEGGREITNTNADSLITLKKEGSGGTDVSFDATIDTRKKEITIRPTSDFESSQIYYVAIGPDVEDDSANLLEAGASATFTAVAIFSDISASLTGIARRSSVAWGDYDKDGDLDILLSGYDYEESESITKIFDNLGGNGKFENSRAGLTGVSFGSATWGDYDEDGYLDILLTGQNYVQSKSIATVWQNNSGEIFSDIEAGLPGVIHSSAAWGDYDGDGDLDILLAGGYDDGGDIPKAIAKVYRNDNGVFTDIYADLTGVYYGSAMWGDYDNDGDLDILLAGHDGGIKSSKVYRNDNGEFSDIEAGLIGISSGCAIWGDYDNDDDLDILLTGYDKDMNKISKVYRNDSGKFTDIRAALSEVYNSAAAWGDYDNDNDLDILLTGDDGADKISEVYRNDNGKFTAVNAGLAGVSNGGVAWGDYDNDGYPDILLTGEDGVGRISKIYRNNLGNSDSGGDELRNAIMALKILAGISVEYYEDINGNNMIGMEEAIYNLRRAANME